MSKQDSKKEEKSLEGDSEPLPGGLSIHGIGFAVGIGLTGIAIGTALLMSPNEENPLLANNNSPFDRSTEDHEEIL